MTNFRAVLCELATTGEAEPPLADAPAPEAGEQTSTGQSHNLDRRLSLAPPTKVDANATI